MRRYHGATEGGPDKLSRESLEDFEARKQREAEERVKRFEEKFQRAVGAQPRQGR